MKRVRALTGTSRMPSRAGAFWTLTLTALLGLLALAAPALAEPPLSMASLERTLARLESQVEAEAGSVLPDSDGDVATALSEATVLATDLPEGQSATADVALGSTATYEFTVDVPDLVAVRASASGSTDDADGLVGFYELRRGGTRIDTIRLKEGQSEESWFPLPAGTYSIAFRPMGSASTRTLSLYWTSRNLDLDGGQLTLPDNRSYDSALPVDVNRQVHGVFYWGYHTANPDSKLDGHFYRFTLAKRSAVTLTLGSPGLSQIAMMDSSGEPMDDANGVPVAASGVGSASVDCGIFDPGTYTIFVSTEDPASWRQHYVAQVFAYPVDSLTTVTRNVYRLYNQWSGEHFFTADGTERNAIAQAGWKDEGIAWVAPSSSGSPVWRLLNPYTQEHLYTRDANERATLVKAGWRDEGIGWYSDGPMGKPVYRLYNKWAKKVASHHYTTDANEYRTLAAQGWSQEGECWYGLR